MGNVGAECPVCEKALDIPLDLIRCNRRREDVFQFSYPLNSEDIDQSSTEPSSKTWKCSECSENTSVQPAGSMDPSDADAPDAPSSNVDTEPTIPPCKICSVCNASVKNPFNALPCCICKEVFHYMCTGYTSETEFDEVTEDEKIRWNCSTCFARYSLCGSCELPAENPFDILRCHDCKQMCHYFCVGFTLENFDEWTDEEKTKWLCVACAMRNV